MKPSHEIIVPRVRCTFCGGADVRVIKTMAPDGFGDVVRYTRCHTCGETFRTRETDNFEDVAEFSTRWKSPERPSLG